MRIHWTPEALDDMDAAASYGLTRWPMQALRLVDDIIDSVARLVEHPCMGREGGVAGTRELVLLDPPFIIVYAVDRELVTILYVNHQRMRWPGK